MRIYPQNMDNIHRMLIYPQNTDNIYGTWIFPRNADSIHEINIYPQNADNIYGTWIFPRNVEIPTIISTTRMKYSNLAHNLTLHLYSLHKVQHVIHTYEVKHIQSMKHGVHHKDATKVYLQYNWIFYWTVTRNGYLYKQTCFFVC